MSSPDKDSVTFGANAQPTFDEITRWARAQIDPDVSTEIHPADDMYGYVTGMGRSQSGAWTEYFWLGKELVFMLEQVLAWCGRTWRDVGSFLDFASGYGRGTRYFLRVMPREAITVSDILADAVRFQREHFKVRAVVSNVDPDVVEFPQSFDLVSVVSLFSHLPRVTFESWLVKLTGVLSPGGILVFTTHGLTLGRAPIKGDFEFVAESESSVLDRSSYGSTYCSPRFVQGLLEQIPDVSLLAHIPRGLNLHQDVYVVGKGITQPGGPCELRPHVRIHTDLGTLDDESRVHLAGWALDEDRGPVQSVRIYLDAADAGEARLGVSRPDVAQHFGPPTSAHCGWSFEMALPRKKPRWAVVVARSADSAEVRIVELREPQGSD